MTPRMRLSRLAALGGLLCLSAGCAALFQDAYDAGAKEALRALEAAAAQPQAPLHPELRYRLPVVSQITLPARIVGGALIPAHPTYVVLEPGAWRLADRPALDRAQMCPPTPEEGAP
jgi:hypothetical protein